MPNAANAASVNILLALLGLTSSLILALLAWINHRLDRFEDRFQTKEMCETLHREAMARG